MLNIHKPSLSAWKPLRGWRVRHPSLCRGAPGWSSPQGLPDLSQDFSPLRRCPTARGAYRIIAILTKVEPDRQGWTLLGIARSTRWPKYISVSTPPDAGASRGTADPDGGQRIW